MYDMTLVLPIDPDAPMSQAWYEGMHKGWQEAHRMFEQEVLPLMKRIKSQMRETFGAP